jgi:CRISPR-associated endonuclease/helicase Cas3
MQSPEQDRQPVLRIPNARWWAKTVNTGTAGEVPGISVYGHCLNVGFVAEALIRMLPEEVRRRLPAGTLLLVALHDIGKITIGFQAKCANWFQQLGNPQISAGQVALSVKDHALVSQVFAEEQLSANRARLWAVALGAHHGQPKGRSRRIDFEYMADVFSEERRVVSAKLASIFGALPAQAPAREFGPDHSDLWLLAGLITVADWIGSSETWFSPSQEPEIESARQQASRALKDIGWPGGRLRLTGFREAFQTAERGFDPNDLQTHVAKVAESSGVIVVEGPMGCGKTEAALHAAQRLICSGAHHGFYFALPTQVTSNRVFRRVEAFLRNTLADTASLRLAHGNAWLEDDHDMRISPSYSLANGTDEDAREARLWFASSKQALLAPYGVGTVDQALQGIVAVKHFFVRRFALAGKVVILDEVHSYDVYTGTLIGRLVRELVNLKCTVIILSATLTAARRAELLQDAGVAEKERLIAYPLVSFGKQGETCNHTTPDWQVSKKVTLRTASLSNREIVKELSARAEAGQHVLWIRNTVVEAQEAFREVRSEVREGAAVTGILHSRFPFARRAELEDFWLDRLGRERAEDRAGSVLIATQVVEQSVDIDLDFMVSDLAPTDMLLQRLGRLWRHERSRRAASEPEFWVNTPFINPEMSASELKGCLGRSGRVYAPYVLLRSLRAWQARTSFLVPGEIRAILEETYQEVEDEPGGWNELHQEMLQEKRTLQLEAEAATRVLGNPQLRDEEGVLTRRRSAPTRPLLLVRRIESGPWNSALLTALDGQRMEVTEHEWRRDAARFIHRWTVRVPQWMAGEAGSPPGWLKTHGDRGARVAVVQDSGRCLICDQESGVHYDPQIGVTVNHIKKPVTQWTDEDEFD